MSDLPRAIVADLRGDLVDVVHRNLRVRTVDIAAQLVDDGPQIITFNRAAGMVTVRSYAKEAYEAKHGPLSPTAGYRDNPRKTPLEGAQRRIGEACDKAKEELRRQSPSLWPWPAGVAIAWGAVAFLFALPPIVVWWLK